MVVCKKEKKEILFFEIQDVKLYNKNTLRREKLYRHNNKQQKIVFNNNEKKLKA